MLLDCTNSLREEKKTKKRRKKGGKEIGNTANKIKTMQLIWHIVHAYFNLFFMDSAIGYYPGSQPIHMKVLFQKGTGKIYGAQAIGAEGVDKRIDVIASKLYT